jgi:transketolase
VRQEALKTVHNLAKNDPRVLFIGSDLGAGTLEAMRKELPQQFFMEGISEQYIVGFTSGLAQEGFIPFFNTIGTFITRRAYEQICIDIALHNLPVRLLSGGGGMVYAPLGPTHTAIEDISLMLSIPGLQVFAPADANEMRALLEASINDLRPYYIRFGKGGEEVVTSNFANFDFMPKVFGSKDSEIVICTTGVMLQNCLSARKLLEGIGKSTTVIHFPYLNELRIANYLKIMQSAKNIVCVEEHVPRGGLFTQMLHEFVKLRFGIENFSHISLPNTFSHNYGSQENHLDLNGLTKEKIYAKILELNNSVRTGML